MTDKIKSVLNIILEQFKTGNVPQAIAFARYPIPNIPSAKWSLCNQLLMVWSQTSDARGFLQWKQVNRQVKKGSKSISILVPLIKTKENENGEELPFLKGFMAKPVFRVEDTEGEPLDYEPPDLPDLPLLDKAREWGLSVKSVAGSKEYYGYYVQSRNVIALASPEESVLFHELVHCADGKNIGNLKQKQDPIQEIVAELGALSLCNIVGKDGDKHIGNSYRYIENYARELKISPHSACLQVLSRVEKALNLILGKGGEPCPKQ
jgi:hypothetical protein